MRQMLESMPVFKTKKLQTETLGEYLIDARQRRGFSREEVTRLTQIPVRSLQKLEESDYSTLPADVYVKGFLKNLAEAYKVEPEVLIEQFEKERGVARSLKKIPLTPRQRGEYLLPRFTLTPKSLTVGIIIFLTTVTLGYLVWQVWSVSADPKLLIIAPAEDIGVSSRSILLRGSAEPGARVYVNGQEIAIDESGEFQEVLNLSEGTNQLLIRAENRFGKITEIERVVVVSPIDTPPEIAEPVLDKNIVVTAIIGPKNSWIKVLADGEVAQEGNLEAGQTALFTADQELIFSTGNAGSTKLIYNGQDLGILGKPGEVLSQIRFTP